MNRRQLNNSSMKAFVCLSVKGTNFSNLCTDPCLSDRTVKRDERQVEQYHRTKLIGWNLFIALHTQLLDIYFFTMRKDCLLITPPLPLILYFFRIYKINVFVPQNISKPFFLSDPFRHSQIPLHFPHMLFLTIFH